MEYIKIKEVFYDDIKYMIENVNKAIEKKETKTVNALLIGLCYVLKQVKKLRYYEAEIRMAMEDLYL